jgi:nucleoside-diphosphate-sugar epimerase
MTNSYNNEVFITGATGFVGRYVVHGLVKHKYRINILCRNLEKAKSLFSEYKNIKFINFDINDDANILNFSPPDCLIHCAWSDLDNILSMSHSDTHFSAHRNFLSALIKKGISKIIITGSFSEYGLQQGPVCYSTPTAPVTPYGIAKDGLHKFLCELKKSFEFKLIWLRLFHVYANKNNLRGLFYELENAVKNNQTDFDMTSGEQLLDYMDVEIAADSIVKSMYLNDGVYNVCSGRPLPLKDIVKQWLQLNSYNIDLNLGNKTQRAYNSPGIWGGDPSRIHEMVLRGNHD